MTKEKEGYETREKKRNKIRKSTKLKTGRLKFCYISFDSTLVQ